MDRLMYISVSVVPAFSFRLGVSPREFALILVLLFAFLQIKPIYRTLRFHRTEGEDRRGGGGVRRVRTTSR